MNKFARITDSDTLIRDTYSKAVLNTDTSVVRKHEKRMIDLQKEKVREDEINSMKSDMKEIKQLLQALLAVRV